MKIPSTFLVIIGMFLAWPHHVWSKEILNQEIISFIESYKSAPIKKDEFEKTEEYHKRIGTFVGKEFTAVATTLSSNDSPRAFSYDADSETLTVRLVGNGQMIRGMVFEKFILRQLQYPTKEVLKQNAMGARVAVTERSSEEWSVAIVNMQHKRTNDYTPTEFKLVVKPSKAKRIIEQAKWKLYLTSVLIETRDDKVIFNDSRLRSATFNDPNEEFVSGHTMTALLRRAELIDPETGHVIALFSFGADYPTAPVDGTKLLFGVRCVPITEEMQQLLNLKDGLGCLIGGITPNSVAYKSGLQPGDIVLTFDNKKISSFDDLKSFMKSVEAGQTIGFTYLRNGKNLIGDAQF